jgi:hypothetical protein
MRNRNHTLPLVAVGLFIVCSSPAGANEPAATGAANEHNCSLPANVRNKVEHCNQVGDFGGPHRDVMIHSTKKGDGTFRSAPQSTDPTIITPTLRDSEKKSKKQKKLERDAKKDPFMDIRSDSEPAKNAK